MKSWCYTQIPKHEFIRMTIVGLDFSIWKKLVNEQVRDMAQLADRVRRIEQIKYEKEKNNKIDKVEGRKSHMWKHIEIVITL